jgi:uncharacterized protein YggE
MTMARKWNPIAAAAGLVAVLAAIGCTPETHVTVGNAEQTGITVAGTGKVSVVPDIGMLQLAVQSTQPTVGAARDRAAAAMEAVRASLRSNGIDDKDVATSGFSIQPQYDFRPNSGGTPTISGYIVSNLVTVKVRQLNTLSRLLDQAVAAGGNDVRVNDVSFTVDEPEKHREQARKLAVEDARRHAEQLADAAGVSLGGARSVIESSGDQPIPVERAARSSAQDGSGVDTPVSPGETDITVTVSVVYEIE